MTYGVKVLCGNNGQYTIDPDIKVPGLFVASFDLAYPNNYNNTFSNVYGNVFVANTFTSNIGHPFSRVNIVTTKPSSSTANISISWFSGQSGDVMNFMVFTA